MSYYMIVATAGHDTTSSSTAGAMWALAENPRSSKVKADPARIPGLIDEAIRWITPVKTLHALGHRGHRTRRPRSPRATG